MCWVKKAIIMLAINIVMLGMNPIISVVNPLFWYTHQYSWYNHHLAGLRQIYDIYKPHEWGIYNPYNGMHKPHYGGYSLHVQNLLCCVQTPL
jgi:hypothetical protein